MDRNSMLWPFSVAITSVQTLAHNDSLMQGVLDILASFLHNGSKWRRVHPSLFISVV